MENYEDFKKFCFELSHINLDAYKEKQMKRRIETLITRKGMNSFAQYAQLLAFDKNELDEFIDYITINVTEFFRKPEYWHFLEEKIIPEMEEAAAIKISDNSSGCESANYVSQDKKSFRQLKIWSAGCSTGEEPYSLSMLLLKYFSPNQFRIFATDIDQNVLKKAEDGSFESKSMETIPEEYSSCREKYFNQTDLLSSAQKPVNGAGISENQFKYVKQGKTFYKISEVVKNQIEFKKLDMTQEDFPKNCDLIVCRNVLIYFTEETKQKIFNKFYESLKPGGILFLGHTEQIVYYKNFGFEKLAKNFYRKGQTVM